MPEANAEPLASAQPGDKFVYTHPDQKGYGEHARGDALSAEMTELDLKDGTEVTLLEYDADSGDPLVQWTDSTGIDRITTIGPDNLALFPTA
jgi:hypothetical protein